MWSDMIGILNSNQDIVWVLKGKKQQDRKTWGLNEDIQKLIKAKGISYKN